MTQLHPVIHCALLMVCTALLAACDMNPDAPVLDGPDEALYLNPDLTLDAAAPDATQSSDRPQTPNIIFILVDDLGFGDVGFHGGEIRTPTLNALADTGARFTHYYTYSICSPTRAALLTGRSAFEAGVDGPIDPTGGLPLSFDVFPERLQALGYYTALIGKWHLGKASLDHLPNQRGFDSFYGFLNGFVDHYTRLTVKGALDWQRDGQTLREDGYTTDLLNGEALRTIESYDGETPFFLFLSHASPHSPIQAPAALVDSYAEIEDPVRRGYAAMVEAVDTGVAEIIAALDAKGIRDDTLVIWTSDNGGNTNAGADNGPLRGGKSTGFEGGVRVPAIANWPGVIPAGVIVDKPVSVHDWAPTFMALAGEAAPNPFYVGTDLTTVLSGGAHEGGDVLVGGGRPERPISRSLISWPWKLVSIADRGADPNTQAQRLLFNLDEDPAETTNLADQHPDVVTRMAAALAQSPVGSSQTETRDAMADLRGGGGPPPASFWLTGYNEETQPPVMETIRQNAGQAEQ